MSDKNTKFGYIKCDYEDVISIFNDTGSLWVDEDEVPEGTMRLDDKWAEVDTMEGLGFSIASGRCIYKRIEIEMTWHDEVLPYFESFGGGECKTIIEVIEENMHLGVESDRFLRFIDACRIVMKHHR